MSNAACSENGCDGCYDCYDCYGCRGCYGCDGCRCCDGCDGCDGCYYSFGLKDCKATYKSLFCKGLFGDKYKLFGKTVTEARIDEVRNKLLSFSWYPKQTNAFELLVQNGNSWSKIDTSKLATKDWNVSWKDCPKEMLDYIRSLSEFDAALLKEITGIEVTGTCQANIFDVDVASGDWVEALVNGSNGALKFSKGEKYRVSKVNAEYFYLDASVKLGTETGADTWGFSRTRLKTEFGKCEAPLEGLIATTGTVSNAKPFSEANLNTLMDLSREILSHEWKPVHFYPRPDETVWVKHYLDFPFTNPTSLPPSRMSIVDSYRNSVLSSEERTLRKAGVKDPCGKLTPEGEKLIMAILADQFKTEMVKEAKKFLKSKKGEEDDE